MKLKIGDLIRFTSGRPLKRRQTIGLVISTHAPWPPYMRVLWRDGVSALVHPDNCTLAFNPQSKTNEA